MVTKKHNYDLLLVHTALKVSYPHYLKYSASMLEYKVNGHEHWKFETRGTKFVRKLTKQNKTIVTWIESYISYMTINSSIDGFCCKNQGTQNEAYQNDKHMFLIWRFNTKPTWSWTLFEFTSHCAYTRGTWFHTFLQFIFIILLFILHHPYFGFYNSLLFLQKGYKDRTLHMSKAIRPSFIW